AHRLRTVLEAHPGVAGILKTRDPLGPHSLALAEAFLGPLQAAGFGDRQAGLAFFLLVDYTIGFAVGGLPTSVNEQRVRHPATRTQLPQLFRSLPPARSPTPPASRSGPFRPRSTSNASATRRPGPSCTSSSAHSPLTVFPPSSPWAHTSGSTTATSGSAPASTSWSPGWSTRATPPAEPRLPAPPRRP